MAQILAEGILHVYDMLSRAISFLSMFPAISSKLSCPQRHRSCNPSSSFHLPWSCSVYNPPTHARSACDISGTRSLSSFRILEDPLCTRWTDPSLPRTPLGLPRVPSTSLPWCCSSLPLSFCPARSLLLHCPLFPLRLCGLRFGCGGKESVSMKAHSSIT